MRGGRRPWPMSLAARPRYKMGLQLYTIRDAMARDVVGTLKRIAALGYEDVETYGFDPEALGYYRLPARESRICFATTG